MCLTAAARRKRHAKESFGTGVLLRPFTCIFAPFTHSFANKENLQSQRIAGFFVYQCFAGFPKSQNAAIIFNFLQASLPAVKAARISPGGSYYFSHDFFSMSISAAIPGNSFFSASNLATATAALLAAESFRFRLHACAPGPAACGTGGVGVIAGSC